MSGRDFPSPLRRLLVCLGITPHICPPHRPDKNAYVERYHRTYGQECLHVHRPSTLKAGDAPVTEAFLQHYNNERPQEATLLWECPSSGGVSNLAHRTRPRHLRVDPDAWLTPLDQKVYLRHVGRDGCVDVDLATSYLGPETGRMERPLPGGSAEPPVCRVAPGPGGQATSRSPAWSARRWPWTTLCSTSCKRRWLLRDVLLPVGEDKVRQPPLWGEGA